MKKILPLQDPPLKGYLIHAYPLSIVTTTEKSKPWLYSNYVQIWCDKNLFESAKVLKIDFFEGSFGSFKNYPIPWLEVCKMNNRLIEPNQILEHLVEWLNKEHYVYTFVDEYYISDRIHHVDGNHFPHTILVHGYDQKLKQLYISGYDRRQHFKQSVCSFEEFKRAYLSLYTPEKAKNYTDDIYLLNLNEQGQDYTLDLELVCGLVDDYLNARNSCKRLRMFFKPGDHVFGIGVYDYMLKYLDELLNGNIQFDIYYEIRPFHNFWEHKMFMLERLRYLNEQGLVSSKIVHSFLKVENSARRIRWLLIKYSKQSSSTTLREMKVLLRDLREMERQVLSELLIELNFVR
ncbi:hypothetical protein [Bacillus sp. DX3.1]|uniref:hypothetical protein n=1 Tax=Bacillus sp. DX3.1 TaxID=3052091 RepID=UPI0025704BC6|nr:hypothetical protein [Bacillus sp. DX3.1]WJE84544.1 hypothetical protein QRE67_28430 [Bacillus sp. DX3.1]